MQPGETLLVHGAGGGSGLAAVDVGKALGAGVIATAGSAAKLAAARNAGADDVINYRETEFRDVVLDLTGGWGAEVIFDVGVRAPGRRMSANDRKELNTLMADYDHFASVSIQASGDVIFEFNDGSTKEWIGIAPSKKESAQKVTDSGRED